MFSFPHMLDFFANVLSRLRTGGFSLSFVPRDGFARFCFGHGLLRFECPYSSKPCHVQYASSFCAQGQSVQWMLMLRDCMLTPHHHPVNAGKARLLTCRHESIAMSAEHVTGTYPVFRRYLGGIT